MTTTLPSPEELLECLAQALQARDFEAAVALLRALAVVDPVSAGVVCEAIEALPAYGERVKA